MRTLDDIIETARDGTPFSNSTASEIWMSDWCYRCTIDGPFQRDESPEGCPLIMVALLGKTPAEWTETGMQDYHCAEFDEDHGDDADTHEGPAAPRLPQPLPVMPGQLELFAEALRVNDPNKRDLNTYPTPEQFD